MTKSDKRTAIALLIAALLITAGLIIHAALTQIPTPSYGYVKGESLYPRAWVVTDAYFDGDGHRRVQLSDGTRENSRYDVPAEDLFVGDVVACMMGDMGTPDDISDDRMILHYYSGWNILTDTGSLDDYLP